MIVITDNNDLEIVSYAYSMTNGGSYVEKIFYELETSKAVMFDLIYQIIDKFDGFICPECRNIKSLKEKIEKDKEKSGERTN